MAILAVGSCAVVNRIAEKRRYEKLEREHGAYYVAKLRVEERRKKERDEYLPAAERTLLMLEDSLEDLKASRDLCKSIEERFLGHEGEDLDRFRELARSIRGRQLDARHDDLMLGLQLARSRRASYTSIDVFYEPYDRSHPTFNGFRRRARRGEPWGTAKRRAAAKRYSAESDARSELVVNGVLMFFTLFLAAEQQRSQSFKDQGRCPRCEGERTIQNTSRTDCAGCGGTGLVYNSLCHACHGKRWFNESRETVECPKCEGSGTYPK